MKESFSFGNRRRSQGNRCSDLQGGVDASFLDFGGDVG
jgi:hypothetical protein